MISTDFLRGYLDGVVEYHNKMNELYSYMVKEVPHHQSTAIKMKVDAAATKIQVLKHVID